MLISYLFTLLFVFMMSVSYGIYKLIVRMIDGHFFVPTKKNMTNLEDYYKPRMPDQTPINEADMPDELYAVPEEHVNPELIEKNRLYDEKIERLKKELHQAHQFGVVYEEDHAEVDARYIPKPTHEYTDER